jgi:hypothetical protein
VNSPRQPQQPLSEYCDRSEKHQGRILLKNSARLTTRSSEECPGELLFRMLARFAPEWTVLIA